MDGGRSDEVDEGEREVVVDDRDLRSASGSSSCPREDISFHEDEEVEDVWKSRCKRQVYLAGVALPRYNAAFTMTPISSII